MGLYDRVQFDCPSCHKHCGVEAQTISGYGALLDYGPDAVPVQAALGLLPTAGCWQCGARFTVCIEPIPPTVRVWLEPITDERATNANDDT